MKLYFKKIFDKKNSLKYNVLGHEKNKVEESSSHPMAWLIGLIKTISAKYIIIWCYYVVF